MSKVYKTGFVVTGDASGGVKAMKATREEMDKLGETQKKSKAQWAEAAKAQRLATAAAASSDSQFNALNSTLKNTVGALAGIAGVSFTVQGLTQSISDAKSLRDAVNQVGTLLDDTSGMEAYRKNIVEMGKEWGDTGKQASALYNIVSAGHSGLTESARILEQANILAMGGVTDVFAATDGLTSALNAYNKTASSAADVSDSFFVAMKYGKTTIEELAGSIGSVAPIAATAGASFDELMAAAAAITSTGVSTSEAMVQLKGVMLELINPAEQSAKYAKEIGLEFSTAALKAKGLSGFLAELTEKTGGSEEAMGRLFGNSRALSGAMSLTGATADKFGSALDAMAKKAGESEVAMNKLAVGAEFALDMIAIKLDALKLEVGEGALDALEPSLIFINENFDELISTTAFLTKTTVGLFATYKLGPPLIRAVTLSTAAMSSATQTYTVRTLAATAATNAARLAMLALPHVAVAAGVAAVVYAFTQYNNQQKETIALADKARASIAAYNAEQNSVKGLQARLKAEEEALAATLATAAAHEAGTSQAAQSLEKLRSMMDSGNFSGDTLVGLAQNYEKLQASIESATAKAEGSKQRIADLKEALAALGVQTDDTAEKLGGIGKAGEQTSEQSDAIEKTTAALVDQYTKLALGERAYIDYQLVQQSATAAQREQALAAYDSIEALKAQANYASTLSKSASDSVKSLSDVEKQSQRVWSALAAGKISSAQAAAAIDGLAAAGAGLVNEQQQWIDQVKSAIDPLRDIEKAMTKVWEAHAKGLLSDDEVAAYVKTFATGSEKIDKKITETASLTDKAAERIDAAFANAWANIDDGFGGLVDGIKNSFKTLLAEMAHEALTRPILLNIQQNAGSLFGATDAATKTASDAAGGAVTAGGAGVMAGAIAAGALVTVAAINSHNKKDDERMMKYTSEYRQGQQSTGTVLGDIDAKSHSLSNLTGLLVEMGTDSLDVNHGMLRSLQAIESGIKGVSQGIARQLSSAGGLEDFESTTSTSAIIDKRLEIEKFALNPFGSALDKIGLGFVDDFLGGVMGAISKGIYSKKTSLQDAGIDFANQTLGAIIDSGFVEADAYQQIKTTRKTLGVKKSSTSKETSDLDDAIQYQLGGIFSNAAGVLGDVGAELAIDLTDNFIRNLKIDAGELSLKGLKGEELSAEIESFISSNLDGWAESMLEAADMDDVAAQYQQAGEGVFEALGRLVAQSKNLQQTAERLNLQFNASGLEAAELTQSLAGMAGGFGNLQALTSSYYQEYFSDAEKQADLQKDLTRAFAEYNTELPKSKEEFRALVESVDLTTESGQKAYVTLMNLQAPFSQFVKEIEKTNSQLVKEIEKFAPESHKLELLTADMSRALSEVGLSAPATRDEMWQLMQALDATTEAGADQIATLLRLTDTAESYYKTLEAAANFNRSVQQQLDRIRLNGQDLALYNLDSEFDQLRKEAAKVGGDLANIEKLYGQKRAAVLAEFAEQTEGDQQQSSAAAQNASHALRQSAMAQEERNRLLEEERKQLEAIAGINRGFARLGTTFEDVMSDAVGNFLDKVQIDLAAAGGAEGILDAGAGQLVINLEKARKAITDVTNWEHQLSGASGRSAALAAERKEVTDKWWGDYKDLSDNAGYLDNMMSSGAHSVSDYLERIISGGPSNEKLFKRVVDQLGGFGEIQALYREWQDDDTNYAFSSWLPQAGHDYVTAIIGSTESIDAAYDKAIGDISSGSYASRLQERIAEALAPFDAGSLKDLTKIEWETVDAIREVEAGFGGLNTILNESGEINADLAAAIKAAIDNVEQIEKVFRDSFQESFAGAMGVELDSIGSAFDEVAKKYSEAAFSQQERLSIELSAHQQRVMQFGDLGITADISISKFRELFEAAQGVVDGETLGRWWAAADAVSDMSNTLDKISNLDPSLTADPRLGGLNDYLQSVHDYVLDQSSMIKDNYRAQVAAVEQWQTVAKNLRDYVEKIRISELSPYDPGQKLELASESFARLLVEAEAGDLEAARQLSGAADAYLKQADSYYGRSDAYVSVFDEVAESLDRMGVEIGAANNDDTIERLNQAMLSEQQKLARYAERELQWAQEQAYILTGIEGALSGWPEKFGKIIDGLADSIASAVTASKPERSEAGTASEVAPGTYTPPDEQRSFYDRAVEGGVSHHVAKVWSGLPENAVKALDKALTSGGRIPAFAKGGDHIGGMRLVGEYGPELEVTGPSRIFNADDTRKILAGNNAAPQVIVQTDPALITELQQLRAEVAQLRSEQSHFNAKAEQQRSDQQQATEAVVRATKATVGVI